MKPPPTTASGGPASSRPLRAVGYLRVSTAGQAEKGMSLQVQREAVTAFAAEKGYELVQIVEEAASGGVRSDEEFSWEHRPVLLDVMARAAAGGFDALIVARLDRLSRDHATLTVLERRLQRHKVDVISVAEENGDGATAKFIRGQLALVAELERALIHDRMSAGKAAGKRQGRHVTGWIPFGYRPAGGGLLEVDNEQAEVVRSIFAMAREGLGPGPIARRLTAYGTPGPTGKPWGRQTVRNLIGNALYAGELHGVKRAQPAIVSRRVWNEAQVMSRRRVTREPSDEEIEARIAEIEARWDKVLDEYADAFKHPRFERREQNFRNAQAGKRRRKGLPARGTVANERRAFAEAKLFHLVHEQRNQVPVFDVCCRQLAELEALAKLRETRMEARAGF
jgi:DNA invertase Pin-like site-specific DNA recombinase